MWYRFLLISSYLLYVRGADKEYEIIRWTITSLQDGSEAFDITNPGVVSGHKPFKIILENYNASELAVQCFDKFTISNKFDTISEQLEEPGKEGIVIKVDDVDYGMSTHWKCTVWKYPTHRYITFIIHIKGKEKVTMAVGTLVVGTNITDMEYDGVGEYSYVDGEMVDFVCKNYYFVSDENFLRLRYHNAKGKTIFATNDIKSRYPINFRKMMTEANDNDYIDCTYLARNKMEYKYKIVFKLKAHTTSQNPLKITADYLKLVAAQSSESEDYQYRFVDGQVFSVVCEMDPNLHGKLKLGFETKNKNIIEANKNNMRWKVTKRLNATRDLNNTKLWCVAEGITPKYQANVLLLLENADPYIVGLSPHDVIQEYSKDYATWYIDYQYTVNQTLNLTCVAAQRRLPRFQWIMKDKGIETHLTAIGDDSNNYYSLTLQEQHNGKSIICNIVDGRAVVNLYLKLDSPLEEYADKDPLKITADYLKLVAAQSSESEDYQYRFVDGQVFSVVCEMDPNLHGKLKLGFETKNKNIIEANKNNMRWKVTKRLNATRDLNNTKLWCVAEGITPKYQANVLLLLENADPYIVGLSPHDVIQEYSKDYATWYIDYQYTVNQTLNLTCVAAQRRLPRFQWIMKDKGIETHLTAIGDDSNNYYSLTLQEQHNGKSIICNIVDGRAVVNLYLKLDSPLEEYADKGIALIVGASVTISVIALMGVCIIMCSKMRKKKGVRQESRENLTRESPIPAFPSQWAVTSNDYQEEAMTTNSLYVAGNAPVYARPMKNAQRSTEPLYHTIDPVYNEPYSEDGHGTAANECTSPVRKNINITNKNHNKDGGPSQNVKEHAYDYIPVTNNSTNEYAEPLYCEIPLTQ